MLGPSGCGKSTLLHLAAGFLLPRRGAVLVDGAEVLGPGVDRGVVFQQHSLFPWETVAGNIGFGPRLKGFSRKEREAIVERYLAEIGLREFAARYPSELSFGMRQRVGLARAFANDPEILLMDEPFASLDALTRLQMQELLMSVWERHTKTVMFVTHDVEEALLLADRILILSARPGRVLSEFRITLPRPRSRFQLADRHLTELKGEILSALTSTLRREAS